MEPSWFQPGELAYTREPRPESRWGGVPGALYAVTRGVAAEVQAPPLDTIAARAGFLLPPPTLIERCRGGL
jgi:hypothetical protein